jgi:hypothetical protein
LRPTKTANLKNKTTNQRSGAKWGGIKMARNS